MAGAHGERPWGAFAPSFHDLAREKEAFRRDATWPQRLGNCELWGEELDLGSFWSECLPAFAHLLY